MNICVLHCPTTARANFTTLITPFGKFTNMLSSVSSENQAGTESFASLAKTSQGARLNELIGSDSFSKL